MGWLHSGQAGASPVMRGTLRERLLRPEATWMWALPWAGAPLTCVDGPLTFAVGRWVCQSNRVTRVVEVTDGLRRAGRRRWAPGSRRWSSLATVERPRTAQTAARYPSEGAYELMANSRARWRAWARSSFKRL